VADKKGYLLSLYYNKSEKEYLFDFLSIRKQLKDFETYGGRRRVVRV
jgi:hypothetical protein